MNKFLMSVMAISILGVVTGCGGGGGGNGGGNSTNPTGSNVAPVATISIDANYQDVSFDGRDSSDSDGRIASYEWEFGDGESATRSSVQHTYAEPGVYMVKLTVEDDDGAKNTLEQELTVEATPIPEVRVSMSGDNVTEGKLNEFSELIVGLRLDSVATTEYRVNVRTVDDSAIESVDYVGFDKEVIFETGSRQATFSVNTIGNDILQQDRRLKLQLHSPSEGMVITSTNSEVFITIRDDDPVPALEFVAEESLVSVSGGEALLEVKMSHLSALTTEVRLNTSGTGRRGADFELPSDIVTIPPLTQSLSVPVTIIDDGVPRGGKTVVFELTAPQLSVIGEDSSHSLVITGRAKVNDTGVQTLVGEPLEDALHGRDATEPSSSDGTAGFSFTKLDIHGNVLPNSASSWVCIQDNVSGVVAEVKQSPQMLPSRMTDDEWRLYFRPEFEKAYCRDGSDDADCTMVDYRSTPDYPAFSAQASGHLNWRAANYGYYWYSDDDTNNGGSKGATGDSFTNFSTPISENCAFPTRDMASYVDVRFCTTAEYIEAMNALAICGFNDWRLPNASELKSIMNLEINNSDLLDPEFMPNDARMFGASSLTETIWVTGTYGQFEQVWSEAETFAKPAQTGAYLTSSPVADNEGSVWCVDSATGETKLCHKGIAHPVRAMRASE
ncbi:DUF1566 domain-containing protein [Neiella sp. HB171785]|uniref:DUF1566 domain-containing protein n=1 Tax=Neiella litorisoli TaxID=2771431 RepID=A0A8J6QGK0_9GAMM|nr:PKD domain-containing protein [Neiella litorisoli]MBD1389544.1 DUF1566 domain-containing protein [Neiella litorisoli]